MKARSIARELALFVLFQLDRKENVLQWDKATLHETIINTVRSLTDLAEEQIASVTQEISDLRDMMMDIELDHPDNESIPLDSPTVAVPIPNTHEMGAKLETLLTAVHNLQEALYVPELKALSEREDVQNYCLMLTRNVVSHQAEIDEIIDKTSEDWRVQRLQKMDLTLLRLAVGELRYTDNVDSATVINESMELANRFTPEESRKLINGILGGVAGQLAGATKDV